MQSPTTRQPVISSRTDFRAPSNYARNSLAFGAVLLVLALCLHELTKLDFWLQDFFYSSEQHTWAIAKRARLPRMLFYHGPKILLIAFGVWLLLSLFKTGRSKIRAWRAPWPPRAIIYLLCCLALFPAFIGTLKKVTGLHCPSELSRYGGEHQFRRLFSSRPPSEEDLGHCFPAGHASGGFALLGLSFVVQEGRKRRLALAFGLAAGWMMGGYQMLVGAHFLSHTLTTFALGLIFAALGSFAFGIQAREAVR